MKKSILILVTMFLTVTLVSAQENKIQKEVKQDSKISEIVLACNMDCGNCSAKVKKQLAYTKGVTEVDANFETDLVVVKYRNDKTDVEKIIASLDEINYKATVYKPAGTKKPGCENIGVVKTSNCAGANNEAKPCSGSKHEHSNCGNKATKVEKQ